MRQRASTSEIRIEDNKVFKKIIKYGKYNIYQRELFWLKRLRDVEFVPNLIEYDDSQQLLVMEYVGTLITNKNMIPNDYLKQLDHIIDTLFVYNCQHNDFNFNNFLVEHNKLYLIDFGWSTFIDDYLEKNVKWFSVSANENLKKFPVVLNLPNRKNKTDYNDQYSLNIVKRELKKYYETGRIVQRV